ncbi:ModD protein [Zavarzinia sp.]|uniref:ModD protein n=1 Tax=Zavarzinia sp. TaxID=2027920 RepID=UPI003561F955
MLFSDAEIDRLVAEDVPFGDLTTDSLGIGGRAAVMTFTARSPLVAACTEEAARVVLHCGGRLTAGPVASGTRCPPGTPLMAAEGTAAALFAAWKVAQNLIEWASGIATATRELVDAARAVNPAISIACTRKTVPGTRRFSAKAIRAGGGVLHRLGLSETILLFPEHQAFFAGEGGIEAALRQLQTAVPERTLVIEVKGVDEALAAADRADVLQLEKFTPEQVAEVAVAVRRRPGGGPVVAAAGGIGRGNVAVYAATGADVLVTSAPYTARPSEVQVRLGPPPPSQA